MVLDFCPKCEGIIIPVEKEGKLIHKCVSCNFIFEETPKRIIVKESMIKKAKQGKGVCEDKNLLATYSNICKKCGHDKAQVLDLGIFYSDEDNLILLKCGKCGYSERIGRKVS